MSFQLGTLTRNARLNAITTELGSTATLVIYSGAEAANCAASSPSGVLATISLPSTPFAAASAGAMALSGTWSVAASASGTAASFRVFDSSSVCQMQGTVGTSGTDMILDNTSINSGQTVTITTFGLTDGNS